MATDRPTPSSSTIAQDQEAEVWEDIDLYEDEKEYVQASNEELEEENDDEDVYKEAKEAEEQAEHEHKKEVKETEELKEENKEVDKTQDDGFEEAKLHKPAAEEPVDEEVIYLGAHSSAV